MTGVGSALVVALTAFLMGILAMHWQADHLLLWQSPLTHESLISAHSYYSNTLLAPVSSRAPFVTILHGAWTAGAILVVTKLLRGRKESNWLFDGASLFLYAASLLVYSTRVLPSLSALPALVPAPKANPADPADATLLPLRELASSNAVLAAALFGVVILQCGQYYSERLEERERTEESEARVARRRRRLAEIKKEQEGQAQTRSRTGVAATGTSS
ncbi:unnamed protein product [Parajaminaea phylloscopi]